MAPGRARRYFVGLSRNTILLAFASLFADISTEMLYPVLPIFLTQVLKANGSVVGLVEGIAQATQNIIQGFSGSLSDRLQRRKPIALAGYLLAALAKPVMGVATAWQGVLGGRFLDRLGAGARSAPRDALIAASVDAANTGRAFGLEGVGDNAGAFLGPLLAIFLLIILHLDMRLIFYLAVIPGLLAFLMVLFVQEGRVTKVAKSKIDINLRQFPRSYWKYLAATALFGIGNSSNAFLILRTKDIGASLTQTIMIYAGFNLVAALISYLLLALSIFLVAYMGFAATSSIALIAVLFVFYGLYQGIFRSVGKAMASDYVPAVLRASSVGWYSAVVGLSGLVASLVAGQLWDYIGHTSVFLFGAAMAAVGGIALVILVPQRLKNTT
jgi:MFS family permease